jgi:predicted short-subunit dehydrogenase-like oxidoreductase (DUF2520 family)
LGTRFAIVGAGKVGRALALLLARTGYEFLGAASRSLASARAACEFAGSGRAVADPSELTSAADLVLITTPDDAIGPTCRVLATAGAFRSGAIVAHCSGALPSTVLEDARPLGVYIGSLHPLQTFATAEQAVRSMPGAYCAIEGDPEAVAVLEEIAAAIGARSFRIRTEDKALYHAAAVMACNYLVALEDAAARLAVAAGVEPAQALPALLPMVRTTVDNLGRLGAGLSLTGPIARGDVQTVRLHLDALAARTPHLVPLYKALGRQALALAPSGGTLRNEEATELMRLLE